MNSALIIERVKTALCVRLNRHTRANAYDGALLKALDAALREADADSTVRTVVIVGGPPHFCAGADLDDLRSRRPQDALNLESRRVFDRLADLSKPTIAAICGAARGGGVELALACDLRVASEEADFAFPETALGIIPAAGGTWRLAAAIGTARAKELIFTGRCMSAQEALESGLLNATRPTQETLATALELAECIAVNDAQAVRLAKRAIDGADPAFAAAAQSMCYRNLSESERQTSRA